MTGPDPAFARWAGSPANRLAIIGATGWLGMALTRQALAVGLTPENRRLRLFAGSDRTIGVDGRQLVIERLGDRGSLGGGQWMVAHYAALGKERTEDLSADAFRQTNDDVLEKVLHLLGTADHVRLIFSSSGAASRNDGNPYGAMKREHEHRLQDWSIRSGSALIIPRIFNIGGPFANKLDRYALSSFIVSALAKQPIVIGARGPVLRSYVHVDELNAVLTDAAAVGSDGSVDRFDTAGSAIVEVGDLAARVRSVLNLPVDIIRSFDPSIASDRYVGDGAIYRAKVSAMRRTLIPLDTIVRDTAAWLA